MKLLMSAVVAVMVSSQAFGAAEIAKHDFTKDAKEAAIGGKPVAAQVQREPEHVRFNRFVNACLLEQGTQSPSALDSVVRSIGTDVLR